MPGRFERAAETLVAGVRIRTPMLAIDTVAAGGGSICRWDGTRLRVGPESAGAVPGPAAYGNGGPLTVTDSQRPARQAPAGALPGDLRTRRRRAARRRRGRREVRRAERRDRPDPGGARRRASSTSPWRRWPARSARYRSSAATTSPTIRSSRWAARRGSARAASPPRSASAGCWSRPTPACCRRYGIALADVRAIREATVDAPLDADVTTVIGRR